MRRDPIHLATDVLVVGAGGAGMYAAISAARCGADVILADKSLIGRGGATIMAQMTVAAAVGHQAPDHWTDHYADTVAAGRGLCNERLAAILCEEAVTRILEMDAWRVGWARENGHMKQVTAPGHSVPRCVYVDFLNTGPAVAKCLRTRVAHGTNIARISGLAIIDLVLHASRVVGAVGFNLEDGAPVTIEAGAVVLAAGGLTGIYRRNSASINMGGDSYALALRAGAELVDMEFVQFFPIGHLAPRLVGMDPIMWDPFRYKLGGRLLNGRFEEFIHAYGAQDSGKYTATRDVTSYAIVKENEAGRASPHGGAWLSFQHVPEDEVRAAFGPVIDRLLRNGIDLTKQSIEVSPIAHYHMGGVRVDEQMFAGVPGLYAAGEAVGGANGANRLSGNAIPETFVFGERAGRYAAAAARGNTKAWDVRDAAGALDELHSRSVDGVGTRSSGPAYDGLAREMRELMWDKVGPIRTGTGLTEALSRLRAMRKEVEAELPISEAAFNLSLQDWFDVRSSLLTAEAVTLAALNRNESRGAHWRDDFPTNDPKLEMNQTVALAGGRLQTAWVDVSRQ
jgi:succinate dehydrogenase/fumarate reductase flavoprotein subunit